MTITRTYCDFCGRAADWGSFYAIEIPIPPFAQSLDTTGMIRKRSFAICEGCAAALIDKCETVAKKTEEGIEIVNENEKGENGAQA